MADEKETAYANVEKETGHSGSGLDDRVHSFAGVAGNGVRSGSVFPPQYSEDADEAMKAFEGQDGVPIVFDEATNKRLLRIIDWNILPVSHPPQLHPAANDFTTAHVRRIWAQLPRQCVQILSIRYSG